MSRVRAIVLSAMFVFVSSWGVRTASADPFQVTSGGLKAGFGFLSQPLIGEGLALEGANFGVQSSLEEAEAAFQLTTPTTFAAQAPADFSGVLRVGNSLAGNFSGAPGLLAAPLTMSFIAAPMSLACSGAGSSLLCTGSAPFTFDTQFTFTPNNGDPVLEHLVGAGTVHATALNVDSRPYGAVVFDFTSSQTPEPATLSLFAAGAMMTGAVLWRRRRQTAWSSSGIV